MIRIWNSGSPLRSAASIRGQTGGDGLQQPRTRNLEAGASGGHVPPFREACWHQGRISDDLWRPPFSCKAVGEALVEAMEAHPGREMTVLCGHTHGAGEA